MNLFAGPEDRAEHGGFAVSASRIIKEESTLLAWPLGEDVEIETQPPQFVFQELGL